MVPSNTSCQAKGRVPFSLLMRTLGIFMPPRDWTGRSRPITHSEPKLWTDSPTSLWSPNLSLWSKFRISMTMSPNFWMAHTQQEFLKCLLWVSKKHAVFVISMWKNTLVYMQWRSEWKKTGDAQQPRHVHSNLHLPVWKIRRWFTLVFFIFVLYINFIQFLWPNSHCL